VVRYKYRDERWLAGVFARMIARYLDANAPWFEEFDLLAAVPSYRGQGATRSWDPVGEIMGQLAPMLDGMWETVPDAVVKRGETPRMQGHSWPERHKLAAGPLRQSFVVPDPGRVSGARVLVFDDVLTEGGTLREVARALGRAGATEVAGLVLARPAWSRETGPTPSQAGLTSWRD
jgi:predicted amidophosphoribosyltransferase